MCARVCAWQLQASSSLLLART